MEGPACTRPVPPSLCALVTIVVTELGDEYLIVNYLIYKSMFIIDAPRPIAG